MMRWGSISVDEIDDPDGRAASVLSDIFGARFAGTWVNHSTDGRRQVGLTQPVTADAEAANLALGRLDPALLGNGVDIVPSARSLVELQALMEAALALINQAGISSYSVGINPIENVVDGLIGVDSWEAERLGPLRDLIDGSDGGLVLDLGRLELLETTQSADWPAICFVRLSYEVFLGRSPTSEEETAWVAVLKSRPSHLAGPAAVGFYFDILAASDEWLGGTVAGLYEQALDRSPESAGRAYWTGQLRSGVRVHKVASFVFGSAESYARAGGTDQGFVTALYERILRRSPDPEGLSYWVSQVQATGTDSVAARFFESPESRHGRVSSLYRQVLDRGPDADGRAYWSERMLRLDDVRVAASLAASSEFIYRSGVTCDPPVETVILR